MVTWIAKWLVNAIALTMVSFIVPGIHVDTFSSALIAVAVISFLNMFIKPILFILTLPITILTLGLFTFILNAGMFLGAGALLSGFTVDGFIPALIGSMLFSFFTMLLRRGRS